MPQMAASSLRAANDAMGGLRSSRSLSEAREVGVTFNRELPAGRADVPMNQVAASVPTAGEHPRSAAILRAVLQPDTLHR